MDGPLQEFKNNSSEVVEAKNFGNTTVIVSSHSKSQTQDVCPNTTTSLGENDNSVSNESQDQQGFQDDFVKIIKHQDSPELIKNARRSIACQTFEQFESIVEVNFPKEITNELHELRNENSELKLQLNAAQQANATLELEIRQKEEVIVKTQEEAINTEETYKLEIKQLKVKFKETPELIDLSPSTNDLEQQLKEAKETYDFNFQVILGEYENRFAEKLTELKRLHKEYQATQTHLATLEMAFSDVHSKYEKTKQVLIKMKHKQDHLEGSIRAATKSSEAQEERYNLLKAHASGLIEKSNRDLILMKEQHEAETNKMMALLKRFEIKCKSLEVALMQKDEENKQLSALCDEVTGKRM